MKTYLGYTDIEFGISSKNVPINVVVLGEDRNQYQFEFNCNVDAFLVGGSQFGIRGDIDTRMWKVSAPNRKEMSIPCVKGIMNEARIDKFSEGVWNVAKSSLLSAYKLVWGNDADKVANGIVMESIDSLASKAAKYGLEEPVQIILKNYYEKNLKAAFSKNFFKLLIYPSKMVVAHCPVDIYVYNSDNVLIGSIVDNESTITGDGVALWTEGDDKYIQIFNGDYQIVYKATGEGTMSLDIYDQVLNNINCRTCGVSLIPLSEGIEYTQFLNDELLMDVENYVLVSNQGTKIEIDNEEIPEIDLYPKKDVDQEDSSSETKPETGEDITNHPSTGETTVEEKKDIKRNNGTIIPSVGTLFKDSSLKYIVTKQGEEVSLKESENKKVVVIPDYVTVNGIQYKVTAITANAFSGCKKLKSVTIGNNVTTIGNNAFKKCTSLKKVIIPARVTTIGKNAFAGCKKLKNVIVKTKVLKKIGKNAFKGLNKAAKIKVPKKKLTAYKKLFKKAKLAKSIRITR